MSELLLHPSTKSFVNSFCSKPNHGLLIMGGQGAGKRTLAREIARHLLKQSDKTLTYYPYFIEIGNDEEKSISIEAIRSLQEAARLKTPGSGTIRRILAVYNADRMTIEAQNAFLKLLEEPPADTVIILTALSSDKLLPTIVSRVVRFWTRNPSQEASKSYFLKYGQSETAINRAYHLSEGSVGLMNALLDKETTHPLVASVEYAKSLLGMPYMQRLKEIDAIAKDKHNVQILLFAIERVCHATLLKGIADAKDTKKVKRAAHSLRQVLNAQSTLRFNPNQKLLLSDLFLNL